MSPDAWGGVREGLLRWAEAHLRSRGWSTAVWPPTPDGVSAGHLANDPGSVTRAITRADHTQGAPIPPHTSGNVGETTHGEGTNGLR